MATAVRTRGKREDEDEGAEGPLRRCIATGETLTPDRMVRFVVDPDGRVTPDVAQKLPGRGVWVTSRCEDIQRAVDRDLFSRAFRAKLTVHSDLAAQVEALIVARLCDLLGLARRAGMLTMGFGKVEPMLRGHPERVAALVEASNSGGADRGKLIGLVKRNREIRIVGCLSDQEIGVALGRENVVHSCLSKGALADRFLSEAERLGGFRVLCPAEWDVASHREAGGVEA